jgi:hypothetical protein
MKYRMGVSGYVIVTVEANSPEEAEEKALNETVAGELYDYVFEYMQEEVAA